MAADNGPVLTVSPFRPVSCIPFPARLKRERSQMSYSPVWLLRRVRLAACAARGSR